MLLDIRKNFVLTSVLSITILLSIAPFAAAEATVFKIATISPDGTSWMKRMREGAAVIEKRTSGRVKFKFYPGGVMGNDQSVLRKIRIGQLQGGALTDGGMSKIFTGTQIYGVPFMFRSYDEVDYIRSRIDKVISDGLEHKGFVTFGFAEGGFAYFMSRKPLQSADDVKGQKVWVPAGDRLARTLFETGGISPISLSLADVMTGLQTGLINTVIASPIGAIALQWYTKVKYMTDTPLVYIYAMLAIDSKAFNRLSKNDQAIFREVMGKIYQEIDKQNRLDNAEARKALRKQGINFVTITPEERQRWQTVADKAEPKWKEEKLFSAELYDRVVGMLEKYRTTQFSTKNRK